MLSLPNVRLSAEKIIRKDTLMSMNKNEKTCPKIREGSPIGTPTKNLQWKLCMCLAQSETV